MLGRAMVEHSLTDMSAVKPRGPKIFIAVLAAAAAAGAGWYFFLRPQGPIGEPEDPAKILVVGSDEALAGVDVLADHGFTLTLTTLEAVEKKAQEEVGDYSGPQAALKYADNAGIGYVAFATPTEIGLADLQVASGSPTVTAEHRWVVLSVGDLGMPAKVTLGRTDETVVDVPSWVELMRAIFEQERPAQTLFAENQLPMDAVELHKKISSAVAMHGAYNALETKAKKYARERTSRLVDNETADPKPVAFGGPLEHSLGLPLANGGTLLMVRPRVVEDEFGEDVKLTMLPSTQLWFAPPGKTDPADRVRCEALRGGTLPPSAGNLVLDDTGTVLSLDSGDRWDVFRIDPAAKGCDFERLGSVPYIETTETGGTLYAPSGKALRHVAEGDHHGARIYDPRGEPIDIDFPGCTGAGQPTWVDEGHIAVVCVYDPVIAEELEALAKLEADEALDPEDLEDPEDTEPDFDEDLPDRPGELDEPDPDQEAVTRPEHQSWLYVIDIATTKVAAIPLASFNAEHIAWRLRRAGQGDPPVLLAGPTWRQSITGVIALAEPAAALVAKPPADEAAPSVPFLAEPDPTVVALTADAIAYRSVDISTEGTFFDPSPDGTKIVLEQDPPGHHDPHGYDIVLVDLADPSKQTTIAASDKAGHNEPRFTADGKSVVFESRYPVDAYSGLEHAAQIVTLSGK